MREMHNYCLSTYYALGTMLNALHALPHLFLRPTWYCSFYYPHFTYKETEAQK